MSYGVCGFAIALGQPAQDFANQVRWSRDYIAECEKRRVAPGKFVSPAAGEFLSGR